MTRSPREDPAGTVAVALFAKAPMAGRVKTRLLPDLDPEDAAELQAALLQDTARVATEAAGDENPVPRLYCAAAEPGDEAALRRLLPPAFEIVPQGGGDLGQRLARVFAGLLARHSGALAIGADCPDLSPDVLRAALRALARAGAVLGAAADGGYWAIGLDRPRPQIFREIPWSSDRVAELTRRRMAELGLALEELPVLRDIDRFADLLAWARSPNPAFPLTLAWCRARGLG